MPTHAFTHIRRAAAVLLIAFPSMARAQSPPVFDVASIRPSGAVVRYEANGTTEAANGTLRMRDVTVLTCIQWAYGVSYGLISGPPSLKNLHYDITAKTDPGTSQKQMRLMLRSLLKDRFQLAFHTEKKELRVYTLNVARSGIKMKPSAPGGEMFRENSATGMIARSITMKELADYLSDPLNAPLTDHTGLAGPYDLTIDFTSYVDMTTPDVRPDLVAALRAALKGEVGLDLLQQKETVDVMVVDRTEPPSNN